MFIFHKKIAYYVIRFISIIKYNRSSDHVSVKRNVPRSGINLGTDVLYDTFLNPF